MNISLLNVGLPTLSRELGASNTGLQWIVDGYALVFAGFLLAAGSLGDRMGRRQGDGRGPGHLRHAAQLWPALSHSTGQLIAARCGMGLGAACVMPMTLSILTDIYTTEAGLRRAIGIWAATASAGAVVAPLLAGVLLSSVLVGVAVSRERSLASVDGGGRDARPCRTRAPRRDIRMDWIGAVLSILFSAGLVFALIEGPDLGWREPWSSCSCFGRGRGHGALLPVGVALPPSPGRRSVLPHPGFSVGCGVVGHAVLLQLRSRIRCHPVPAAGARILGARRRYRPWYRPRPSVMVAAPYRSQRVRALRRPQRHHHRSGCWPPAGRPP